MAKITVQNTPITVIGVDGDDYISLTDMAKSQLQRTYNIPLAQSQRHD